MKDPVQQDRTSASENNLGFPIFNWLPPAEDVIPLLKPYLDFVDTVLPIYH